MISRNLATDGIEHLAGKKLALLSPPDKVHHPAHQQLSVYIPIVKLRKRPVASYLPLSLVHLLTELC